MPKSLSDLRSDPPKVRPERSLNICLAPHLLAEVQELNAELSAIEEAAAGRPGNRPRRGGEGPNPRAAEIRGRLGELLAEMADYEGEMRVRATLTDGEWRRWVDEHPPRPEDEPGHDRDLRLTGGWLLCDADALIDTVGTFCHAWNSEPLAEGDYAAIFEPNIATADKMEIAQAVVAMYESRLDFQQLRRRLSANLQRLNVAASPAPSGSPTDDSTDGSPAPSSAGTTPRATRAS